MLFLSKKKIRDVRDGNTGTSSGKWKVVESGEREARSRENTGSTGNDSSGLVFEVMNEMAKTYCSYGHGDQHACEISYGQDVT